MEYQVKIDINQKAKLCYTYYTESEKIKQWMPNLKDIKSTKGHLFSLYSQGYFIFNQHGHEMLMEIEVTDIKEPYEISMTYRVPGAVNGCINRFIEQQNKTVWMMDVTFEFEEDPNLDIEVFKNSTKASMEIFKHFMEELHHE